MLFKITKSKFEHTYLKTNILLYSLREFTHDEQVQPLSFEETNKLVYKLSKFRVGSLIRKNFACFSLNPIKLCVLILNILKKLEYKFSTIKLDNQKVKDRYLELIDLLLERIEEVKLVEHILTDLCYNNHQVVDIIATQNLISIMNNPKVNSVITDFWRGPYERNSFLSDSYNFKIIQKLVNGSSDFFTYNPDENLSKMAN